jgi:hypothetical protein
VIGKAVKARAQAERGSHLDVGAGQPAERIEAERRVLHKDGALRLPGSQHAFLRGDVKGLPLQLRQVNLLRHHVEGQCSDPQDGAHLLQLLGVASDEGDDGPGDHEQRRCGQEQGRGHAPIY